MRLLQNMDATLRQPAEFRVPIAAVGRGRARPGLVGGHQRLALGGVVGPPTVQAGRVRLDRDRVGHDFEFGRLEGVPLRLERASTVVPSRDRPGRDRCQLVLDRLHREVMLPNLLPRGEICGEPSLHATEPNLRLGDLQLDHRVVPQLRKVGRALVGVGRGASAPSLERLDPALHGDERRRRLERFPLRFSVCRLVCGRDRPFQQLQRVRRGLVGAAPGVRFEGRQVALQCRRFGGAPAFRLAELLLHRGEPGRSPLPRRPLPIRRRDRQLEVVDRRPGVVALRRERRLDRAAQLGPQRLREVRVELLAE